MKLHRYAIKPIGDGDSGALACTTSTMTPWAGFGSAIPAQLRHTGNGAMRPKDLKDGSTV